MRQFAVMLKGMMEFLDKMSLESIRTLFSILVTISIGASDVCLHM